MRGRNLLTFALLERGRSNAIIQFMSDPVEVISFSAKFASDLVGFASRHGADGAALLALLSLPPEHLHREDVRIPARQMADVWLAAIRQCDDPMIAMHMGKQSFSAQQTTNLIMQSSASVQQALELALNYSSLIANVMKTSISEDDRHFYLVYTVTEEWQLEDPAVVRDCLQVALVAAMNSIGQLTGSPQPPAGVSFTLPAPRFSSELFETFNCPIRFDAERNAIGFDKVVRDLPLASRDLGLQAVIRQYADELLRSFEAKASWSDKIRAHLIERMPKPPTLAEMAQRMSISQRSLQRRLKQEQKTYRQLVEEVRLAFVDRHLDQSGRSLDEVAYLSGYCDAPTMIRAYKRKYARLPRGGLA